MSELAPYVGPVSRLSAPDFGWNNGSMGGPGAEGGRGLTVKDILRTLWRRKLRWALICFVLLVPAVYYILSLPASYTADAMLVLRTRAPITEELQTTTNPVTPTTEGTMNLIRSEMQILTSQTIAERVILDLHLNQPAAAAEPSKLHEFANQIRRMVGLDVNSPGNPEELQLEQAVKNYRQHFSAFNDGKSFVILVSFSAKAPLLAKQVLADHLRFYLADQVKEKEIALDSVHEWLETELVRLADKVQSSDQQLLQFRGSHNLLRTGGETVVSHELSGLVTQLDQARSDLVQKQSRLQDIRNAGNGTSDSTVLQSPLIQKQRQDEELLLSRFAELNNKYNADHPAVRATAAALAATKQSIAAETERLSRAALNDVNVAAANVAVLERQVSGLSKDASVSELTDLSQAQLQREANADRQLYDDLLRRSKQIEIQRQVQQEPDSRVASAPSVSFSPSSPHRAMLMAASTGLFAVLSACFTVFLERGRFQSRSLLAIEAICRVPGLTSVPNVRSVQGRRAFLRLPDPRSVFALSLQTLRNSLSIYSNGTQPKVVAFTSALPGEGKTLLSAFYAQSLAFIGFKVLLIDTDMRQSRLRAMLKASVSLGLEDLLGGKPGLTLAQCVHKVDRGLFDALISARSVANPQALLSSPAFATLVEQAREAYDFVIIDTPPIAAVDDALPVAKLADATAIVIRWGSTPHDVVRAAVRRLDLAGGRVTGAVLNAVDMGEYQASSHDLEAYRPLRSSYIRHER